VGTFLRALVNSREDLLVLIRPEANPKFAEIESLDDGPKFRDSLLAVGRVTAVKATH
jgi:hypothetical protein